MSKKYTVKAGGEELRARSVGFYDGDRIRAGETFHANEGEVFGWAVPASTPAEEPAKGGLLSKPVKDILPALKSMQEPALRALRDEEAGGNNRKSILAAIDDELANRQINPLS